MPPIEIYRWRPRKTEPENGGPEKKSPRASSASFLPGPRRAWRPRPHSGSVAGMPHPLLSDPWVAAKIDAAVQKHGGRWTREQVEAFREQMAWTLATHPKAARLLEIARPSVIESSGERVTGGAVEAADKDPGVAARKVGGQ